MIIFVCLYFKRFNISIIKNMLNNTTKFKVLMHNGIYVNLSMLGNGIYATSIPSLFNFESTIELLIESGKKINTLKYAHHYPNAYFENLNKCELVEFSLIPSEPNFNSDLVEYIFNKHIDLSDYINPKEVKDAIAEALYLGQSNMDRYLQYFHQEYNCDVFIYPVFERGKCGYDSFRKIGYNYSIIMPNKETEDCFHLSPEDFCLFPHVLLDESDKDLSIFDDINYKVFESKELAKEAALNDLIKRFPKSKLVRINDLRGQSEKVHYLKLDDHTLLEKYLKHVMESEGSDFTSDDYLKNSPLFSNEEKQMLQ